MPDQEEYAEGEQYDGQYERTGYGDSDRDREYSDAAASEPDDWDSRKAFLSRIPTTFDSDIVQRIVERKFGEGCVEDVSIVYSREEGGDGEGGDDDYKKGGGAVDPRSAGGTFDRSAVNHSKNSNSNSNVAAEGEDEREHRGFGFVTFISTSIRDEAIKAGTVRGGAKDTSKRKHTIYIRPLDRSTTSSSSRGDDGKEFITEDSAAGKDGDQFGNRNACHLWSLYRCPYGDECRFDHVGEGGCISLDKEPLSKAERDKKKKCFQFKKKGKCKLGEDCPFSHEVDAGTRADKRHMMDSAADGRDGMKKMNVGVGTSKSDKDCINWKTKGKCRKLKSKGGCPYRHDEAVREASLAKKEGKKHKRGLATTSNTSAGDGGKSRGEGKIKQPLSIRVFGMNYDTKEEDIRDFFKHCGPIVEITFPTFDDSGRSKGYCGVLFQSPKAVEKAVLLNESELHGRWLSVQAGKMYLKQWEERERKSRGGGNTDGGDRRADRGSESLTGSSKGTRVAPEVGEFGQKVKRRKKHGYKE